MSFVIVAIQNDKSLADYPDMNNHRMVGGGYTMADGTLALDDAFILGDDERGRAVEIATAENQESILFVDNGGEGFLVYAKDYPTFQRNCRDNWVSIGKWHEVTEAEAKASPGWTFFPVGDGHWFICG